MGMNVSAIAADQRAYEAQNQRKIENQEEESWFGHQLRNIGMTDTADWLEDKDKVCTDGQDDGHLSFVDGAKSFAKGLVGGIPKAIINHPIVTAITAGAGVAAMKVTKGAAAPILWGVGAAFTAIGAAVNIYNYAKSKTDGEAKSALEGMGTTTTSAVMLGATYNSTMNVAKNAGVNTENGFYNTLKDSWTVSKANFNEVTHPGVLYGNSTTVRQWEQHSCVSKPNDVTSYRFNPKGTPQQVEANNPGVKFLGYKEKRLFGIFKVKEPQYGVVDKWGTMAALEKDPNATPVYHLINPKKTQMIMMYEKANLTEDMAVCDGSIYKGSYVEPEPFYANGTRTYYDPNKLQYGKFIDATKQAPGTYMEMPEGQIIHTLEGNKVIEPGMCAKTDHAGNLQAIPWSNIPKRETGFTPEGIALFKAKDPAAAAKYGY